VIKEVSLSDIIFGREWYPVEDPPVLGMFPLIAGTIAATLLSCAISLPIALALAVFTAEIAPRRARKVFKVMLELLGFLPSIVLGFLGMMVIAPRMQNMLNIPTGLNLLTASILLGFIVIPVVASLAEEALSAVPRELRDASYALGATRWETVRKVVIPHAASGIASASLLGVMRALGETMVVLMAAGGCCDNTACPYRSGKAADSHYRCRDGGNSCRQHTLSCTVFFRADTSSNNDAYQPCFIFYRKKRKKNMSRTILRKISDKAMTLIFFISAVLLAAVLAGVAIFLFREGWQTLSLDFLIEAPKDGMTGGGIFTPLVGTVQLIIVSMLVALPVGIITGLYFAEYSKDGWISEILRISIRSLAGVPSVIFGLFGLALFVVFMKFGSCLLSAGLTLGCLSLPLIVTVSEQAFLAVPQDFRDASYALGATNGRLY